MTSCAVKPYIQLQHCTQRVRRSPADVGAVNCSSYHAINVSVCVIFSSSLYVPQRVPTKRHHCYNIRTTSRIHQVKKDIIKPVSAGYHKTDIGQISTIWYQTDTINLISKRYHLHDIGRHHLSDNNMVSGFWRHSDIGRYWSIRSDRTRYRSAHRVTSSNLTSACGQ